MTWGFLSVVNKFSHDSSPSVPFVRPSKTFLHHQGGLTGKCNSELPEIGREFSNDRFFGKLSRDFGKIRYYGTDRKTGSKIDTQGCSFVGQSERQYVCKANHADATYDITYRDSDPDNITILVYTHHGKQSRVEMMKFPK